LAFVDVEGDSPVTIAPATTNDITIPFTIHAKSFMCDDVTGPLIGKS
jgi:hypothetical protein